MFANIQNYNNYHNKKLKNYNLTNCKCAFSSSQVCTCMQNYQISKLTKSPKLQNLKITSAFLYIYKFAHAKFACFHTCMYYKIIKL
jgi:hypothetical protein